jgi:hypothetical protein
MGLSFAFTPKALLPPSRGTVAMGGRGQGSSCEPPTVVNRRNRCAS